MIPPDVMARLMSDPRFIQVIQAIMQNPVTNTPPPPAGMAGALGPQMSPGQPKGVPPQDMLQNIRAQMTGGNPMNKAGQGALASPYYSGPPPQTGLAAGYGAAYPPKS